MTAVPPNPSEAGPASSAEIVRVEVVPTDPSDRVPVRRPPSVPWRERAQAWGRSAAVLARQPAVVATAAAVTANLAVAVGRRMLQDSPRSSASSAPRVLVVSVSQQLILLRERRPDPVRALPPGSS